MLMRQSIHLLCAPSLVAAGGGEQCLASSIDLVRCPACLAQEQRKTLALDAKASNQAAAESH